MFSRTRVSIHAPLAGRDFLGYGVDAGRILFQSTRPSRGATAQLRVQTHLVFVSIHAPLAGRDAAAQAFEVLKGGFNPRAPRGARPGQLIIRRNFSPVSIHAPLAGRDVGRDGRRWLAPEFQSTRPSRGAT